MDTISKLIWDTRLKTNFNVHTTSIPSNEILDEIAKKKKKKIMKGGEINEEIIRY